MDHQKPTILLIFGTLSLGGCGGHPMRPKSNSKVKSQMSKPNEYTDNFKSNFICLFLSVRAKLKKTLCPRTQCTQQCWNKNNDCILRRFDSPPIFTENMHSLKILIFQQEI